MKNKRQKAVALKYKLGEQRAPKVSAKGEAHVAERIIDVAKEHGIPIKEDVLLVEMLSQLDVDEQIPEKLYQAVAEIFAFVYKSLEKEQGN
jgi:flagellar biosynthesis protein